MTESDTPAPLYEPLPLSFKEKFDFRTATTSFIYPDHIIPNVRMLRPYVDEIELLFFESRPDSLPSPVDMDQLETIGAMGDISFNIHLPIDIDICHPDPHARKQEVESLSDVIQIASRLNPTTYTLHLPWTEKGHDQYQVNKWQQRACKSIEKLLTRGVDPVLISIETLDYPPHWLDPIIEEFNLAVCFDVGHLIEYGRNPATVFERFAERITIIHLYGGVQKGRGHLPLDRLPKKHASEIAAILDSFTGTVSLEVFSYEYLCRSLYFLERLLEPAE